MEDTVQIEKGQVWESKDKREKGRRLRVVELVEPHGVALEPVAAKPAALRYTQMLARTLTQRFRLVEE